MERTIESDFMYDVYKTLIVISSYTLAESDDLCIAKKRDYRFDSEPILMCAIASNSNITECSSPSEIAST